MEVRGRIGQLSGSHPVLAPPPLVHVCVRSTRLTALSGKQHVAARRDRFSSHSDRPRPGRRRGCEGGAVDQSVEIAEVNGASSSSLLPRSDDALLSTVIPTTKRRDRRLNLNSGWSADPRRNRSRRGLSHTRYDNMAEASSSSLRRSARRSRGSEIVDEGRAALVKMQTDYRATPVRFSIL